MIFNDKIDRGPGVGVGPETVKDRGGDRYARLGVALDALALADVMQQENEVEEGGPGRLVQDLTVLLGAGLGRGENRVQFPDGAEGMDVRGVAVIVFVLHEAGQRSELGDEATEDAELVHE